MRSLVIACFLLFATTAYADERNLAGLYDCEGENPDGTKYKSNVKITRHGDSYLLEWTFGSAANTPAAARKTSHAGIGIVREKFLSSSWSMVVNGKAVGGVVVYKIEGDKLVGQWTSYPGDGKILRENLTKTK